MAIMKKPTIEAILSGKKTVETRFSKHKILPFEAISVGDIVYMKPPGEDIIGQFRVKKVFFYGGLTREDVKKIFSDYGKGINTGDSKMDSQYQKEKEESYFGTLIFISESERFITSPIKVKKSDLRGWVVLD